MNTKIYLLLLLLSILSCSNNDIPKETDIRHNFGANKNTYEKIVNIFMENEGLHTLTIYPGSTTIMTTNLGNNLRIDNKEFVINKLSSLNINLVRVESFNKSRHEQIGEISFYIFRTGIVPSGGRSKGISYFASGKPMYLTNNLDDYDPPTSKKPPSGVKKVYSKISDNWYIFSDFS